MRSGQCHKNIITIAVRAIFFHFIIFSRVQGENGLTKQFIIIIDFINRDK